MKEWIKHALNNVVSRGHNNDVSADSLERYLSDCGRKAFLDEVQKKGGPELKFGHDIDTHSFYYEALGEYNLIRYVLKKYNEEENNESN